MVRITRVFQRDIFPNLGYSKILKMKTSKFSTILFLFVLTGSFAQEDVRGKWRTKAIRVDGVPSEWANPLRLYHAETGLFFDIQNDSSTLYFCFQSKDEATQLKINKLGMKVEIIARGKQKCKAAIEFPISGKKDNMIEDPKTIGEEHNITHLKQGFILQHANYASSGFITQNGVLPLSDTSAIRLAMNWDANNVLTYEIAIPFKEMFGTAFSLTTFTKAMILKVEINAFTKQDLRSAEDNPAASGAGVAMSGRAMNNSGMGRNSRDVRDDGGDRMKKDPMFEPEKLKQGFYLAKQR